MAESETASNSAELNQKRRSGKRTARACDECRLRKAKCDGLNPCEACQTTDRYCTYNLSAARSTGSGTRIRILEDRLRRARAYLSEAQKRTPSLAHINFDALLGPNEESNAPQAAGSISQPEDDEDQEQLVSMMNAYGQMTETNGNMHRDFFGPSSGLAWIKKTQHYLGRTDGDNLDEHDCGRSNTSAAVQIFDAPLPAKHEMYTDVPVYQLLPLRKQATHLRDVVFAQVYPMFHFLSQEKFDASTDAIYSRHPDSLEEEDQMFVPLLYLVLAMGYLFSKAKHDQLGCRESVAHAMRLFVAARSMVDVAQLRTITSLQTIICLILFLISTARMASAHAFLGAACASAMRQGLHFRSTHDGTIPDTERKVRRRVFWAVTNLDMYVSSILGLPQFLNLTAVDPAIDLTIAAALNEGLIVGAPASIPQLSLAASAKHMELMRIIFKAQGTLYPKPTDPPNSSTQNGTIRVSVTKLQDVEEQFRRWAASLEDVLSYPENDTQAQSIKYELKISYYFSQIVLYRAFLHYLAEPHSEDQASQRKLSYAFTCVRMAKKVIEVSVAHQGQGLLCPASWSSIYTAFLSTICMIFAYATRNERRPELQTKSDIEDAVRLLACTACTTDTGSVRCLEILRRLLRRVKGVVDIDLDRICAETTPCCTFKFPPRTQTASLRAEQLSNPTRKIPDLTSPSVRPATPGAAAAAPGHGWRDNQNWNFVPEPQSLDTSMDYAFSETGQPQPSYPTREDEEMQIPYGGTFSWPGHQFHTQASWLSRSQDMSAGTRGSGLDQSPTPQNLSAEDIAAFMHINALDEPYRVYPGKPNQ